MTSTHGGESPILRYFAYRHLPQSLQDVSEPFASLARSMDNRMPDGPEKQTGLRKLLEAKDCMVRAALPPAPAYPLVPKDDDSDYVSEGLTSTLEKLGREYGPLGVALEAGRMVGVEALKQALDNLDRAVPGHVRPKDGDET